MSTRSYKNDAGFSVVEMIFALIIVIAIVGAGVYVSHRIHTNPTAKISGVSSTSTTQPASSSGNSAATSASSSSTSGSTSAATAASIVQLTESNEQAEAGAYNSADSQIQSSATTPDSSVSNVGGAYNASNL